MITARFLDDLAHEITEHGLDARTGDLKIVADLAVRHNAAASLAGVLLDTSAPEVVRTRAFARISVALRALPASMTTAA